MEDWDISRFESGDKITPMLNSILTQSENETNSTPVDEVFDSENLKERISLPSYNMSAKEFPDECTSNGKIFKSKVQAFHDN